MKKGIFTRKSLREIVPGLTRTQENQLIELHLEAVALRGRTDEEEAEEEHAHSLGTRVEILVRIV